MLQLLRQFRILRPDQLLKSILQIAAHLQTLHRVPKIHLKHIPTLVHPSQLLSRTLRMSRIRVSPIPQAIILGIATQLLLPQMVLNPLLQLTPAVQSMETPNSVLALWPTETIA